VFQYSRQVRLLDACRVRCADVCVKVYMLYKGCRLTRKQTRTVACGLVAPSVAVFNEALLFDMDRSIVFASRRHCAPWSSTRDVPESTPQTTL